MNNGFAIALTDFHVRVDETTEIRPLRVADTDELFQLAVKNRDHLYPWMGWVTDKPIERAQIRMFLQLAEESARDQTQFSAAIVQEGRIIGSIGFRVLDWDNRLAEIGYWLDFEHIGRGIMTAAVRALTGYGFDALELNRIELRCATTNLASAAIAERLGFTHEGVLRESTRVRDEYTDDHVFAMLRHDWNTPE